LLRLFADSDLRVVTRLERYRVTELVGDLAVLVQEFLEDGAVLLLQQKNVGLRLRPDNDIGQMKSSVTRRLALAREASDPGDALQDARVLVEHNADSVFPGRTWLQIHTEPRVVKTDLKLESR
jgi:hypothetical protein